MENKKVPPSYRIALGQIKRYFGDSKPTEKEVKKIAVEIAKRNKLDDTEFFMKWALGQIGTVNEANDSVRDYVDKRLESLFKKEGFSLPKNGPTVKIGYTLWPFADGYEVVNDGVGIKVKKDGKELMYFDNPKLNYNKAVNFLVKKMLNESEDLDEALQIKSEISAMYFIKECIDLEKDSNIKNKLKSVLEFLSKKFKLPITE